MWTNKNDGRAGLRCRALMCSNRPGCFVMLVGWGVSWSSKEYRILAGVSVMSELTGWMAKAAARPHHLPSLSCFHAWWLLDVSCIWLGTGIIFFFFFETEVLSYEPVALRVLYACLSYVDFLLHLCDRYYYRRCRIIWLRFGWVVSLGIWVTGGKMGNLVVIGLGQKEWHAMKWVINYLFRFKMLFILFEVIV